MLTLVFDGIAVSLRSYCRPAMKGESWESPRGPITIDRDSRDIVQNIYMRKVDRKDGELYNIEFATVANVRDPAR